MARRWRVASAGGEVLVPVPADATRVRERGYDQAALLARAASSGLGLPVAELVARTRSTIAQFDLDRSGRRANVHGAFALSPGGADRWDGRIGGTWFVLVDDVVTTGSTLVGCARVLLDAGALGVSAITVARER